MAEIAHAKVQAGSFWTPEMQGRLVTLAAAGLTGKEIAFQLGVTRSAVLGRCHRTGVTLPMDERKEGLRKRKGGRRQRPSRAADAPRRGGRPRGRRSYADAEIAVAIAGRLAGLSYRKASQLIGACQQSLERHWIKDPALLALGRELFERARGDACRRAAERAAELQAQERMIRAWNEGVLRTLSFRNRGIVLARLEGEAGQSIADRFGITRERVRQIVQSAITRGLKPLPGKPLTRVAA